MDAFVINKASCFLPDKNVFTLKGKDKGIPLSCSKTFIFQFQ